MLEPDAEKKSYCSKRLAQISMVRTYILPVTVLALLLLGATGCTEFQVFDWIPFERLSQVAPMTSTLERVELRPAAPDDKYAQLAGRGRKYRWTTEGPVREGLRLVVYESQQRGWQVRDGFWSMRTLAVLFGAPTAEVRQIAEVDSYTLFLTNLGQLIAFDHESEHFCRRAISSPRGGAFVLHREPPLGESRRGPLLIERKAQAAQYYRVDMKWLCEHAALET